MNDTMNSLLKVDGKGWDVALLINKNESYECKECNNICCDAVELGCDHDDNEIDLYCQLCLNQVVKSNNNTCPMNKSHNNPSIQSARSTRKQIMKLKVYCPNSVEYQNKNNNNNDNNMVYDTMDEKEGGYDKKKKKNTKGCHWNGTLNELINDHITKCKILSPDLNQKIMENMNKTIKNMMLNMQQIQNENNKIQKDTKELKDIMEKQQAKTQQIEENLQSKNNEINELQDTVQKQKKQQQQIQNDNNKNTKKLKDIIQKQQQQINDLQKQIENMSQSMNEEKKQNEAEYKYVSDFDTNGILYAVGTGFGKHSWRNPAESGAVKIKSTEWYIGNVKDVVGRVPVKSRGKDSIKNAWFSVDFGKTMKIMPTVYSLRHWSISGWYLRSWNFEGSNDGKIWRKIKVHIDDISLNKASASHSWIINDCSDYYQIFRIYMTGPRSATNNFWELCCSGFEIYGNLRST